MSQKFLKFHTEYVEYILVSNLSAFLLIEHLENQKHNIIIVSVPLSVKELFSIQL